MRQKRVSAKYTKSKLTMEQRQSLIGWFYLLPATTLIVLMNFFPMVKALFLSFESGIGNKLSWVGLYNYIRIFQDDVCIQALKNNFIYLIIEVPIMLVLALMIATILNDSQLKFRGLFRVAIFLPCTTSLVSYAVLFRSLFALDGFVNRVLIQLGILDSAYNFLTHPTSARVIMMFALIWRWTGYNMFFYLAGLQNINKELYEVALIEGASKMQVFWKITVPLLKPIILLTTVMSTNGTLQLFDESVNLTNGGPGKATMTISHYIYNVSFKYVPNFGYATAMSYLILMIVAVLAFVQIKVGDERE